MKEENDSIVKDELRDNNIDNDDFFENKKMLKNNNRRNNNNNKTIIIIILVVLVLLLGGFIAYMLLIKDKKSTNVSKEEESIEEVEKQEENIENLGYVMCDTNTSSLNVRNSIDGDIVDSLSCFKEVTIEERNEESENCKNWYKISYTKKGNNYTGYSCGTYIKDMNTKPSTIKKIKEVVDKANEYYEKTRLFPWCGKTSDGKKVKIENTEYEYLKSEYKNFDELKEYLLSFMDEKLFILNLKLSDYNSPKMYDDYYEIDGNLYCRGYSGKGYINTYTGNYDIEVVSETDDKISANISYEYINEETLNNEESKCNIKNLDACYNSNLEHKIGKLTIKKDSGKYIITNIDFHK